MIKFAGHHGDRKIVGFGLSNGNLDRLREDRPICVKGEEVGLGAIDVVIFWGETEQAMYDRLRKEGLINEQTKVRPMKDTNG